MQRIEIVCFGKLKETFWRDAVAEYTKRLSSSCKLTITEIEEAPLDSEPSQKEIDRALEIEAGFAEKHITPKSYVIALCVEGKQMTSESFSKKLSEIGVSGEGDVVFLIGSSFGLSKRLKERADMRLSFSEMTFPHQLMRVVLCEQLYRAFSIAKGTRYHK